VSPWVIGCYIRLASAEARLAAVAQCVASVDWGVCLV